MLERTSCWKRILHWRIFCTTVYYTSVCSGELYVLWPQKRLRNTSKILCTETSLAAMCSGGLGILQPKNKLLNKPTVSWPSVVRGDWTRVVYFWFFRLFALSDLYLVFACLFSCTALFVSISHVIGCEDRLRNDLYCVGWGVKLCSTNLSQTVFLPHHDSVMAACCPHSGTPPSFSALMPVVGQQEGRQACKSSGTTVLKNDRWPILK